MSGIKANAAAPHPLLSISNERFTLVFFRRDEIPPTLQVSPSSSPSQAANTSVESSACSSRNNSSSSSQSRGYSTMDDSCSNKRQLPDSHEAFLRELIERTLCYTCIFFSNQLSNLTTWLLYCHHSQLGLIFYTKFHTEKHDVGIYWRI